MGMGRIGRVGGLDSEKGRRSGKVAQTFRSFPKNGKDRAPVWRKVRPPAIGKNLLGKPSDDSKGSSHLQLERGNMGGRLDKPERGGRQFGLGNDCENLAVPILENFQHWGSGNKLNIVERYINGELCVVLEFVAKPYNCKGGFVFFAVPRGRNPAFNISLAANHSDTHRGSDEHRRLDDLGSMFPTVSDIIEWRVAHATTPYLRVPRSSLPLA
jgi:hypothetical protein